MSVGVKAARAINMFKLALGKHKEAVTMGDASASEEARKEAHDTLDAYLNHVTEVQRRGAQT